MSAVKFSLAGATTEWQRAIEDITAALVARFPGALAEVKTIPQANPSDLSLGCVCAPKTIGLNRYWLALEPAVMAREARVGEPFGAWHAGMIEPDHLLAHEFGHCLRDQLGTPALALAKRGHAAALADAGLSPSGYALADAEEWWAESFALAWLGERDNPWVMKVAALCGI